MKEDYLWDKTGSDPEIERLENALAAFRYQATEPPALPAKLVPFERKTPRGFARLSFALAGLAGLVIVALGVWFQFSGEKIEVSKDLTQPNAPSVIESLPNEIQTTKPDNLFAKNVEIPKQSAEPKIIKIEKMMPKVVRPNKTIVRHIRTEKPPIELTKDERYAYNQLMTALSITSSKLKLVTDKIERVEEKKAVLENER